MIAMRTYEIWGVINVNMYNSLLSPEFTLETDADIEMDAERERLWQRFDVKKYTAFICERAVIELKALLKQLPSNMRVRYVEGSAEIYSPPWYNYGGDELIFKIRALSHRSRKGMQRYLDRFFTDEWNAEFGPDYRIYEYIRENMGLEDFLTEEDGHVQSPDMEG